MKIKSLKEALREWGDEDYSKMAIAICLGLMAPETNYQIDAKHVLWAQAEHPIGNMLYDFLIRLVDLGVLEHRETDYDHEYRWNPSFRGSWEKNEATNAGEMPTER